MKSCGRCIHWDAGELRLIYEELWPMHTFLPLLPCPCQPLHVLLSISAAVSNVPKSLHRKGGARATLSATDLLLCIRECEGAQGSFCCRFATVYLRMLVESAQVTLPAVDSLLCIWRYEGECKSHSAVGERRRC